MFNDAKRSYEYYITEDEQFRCKTKKKNMEYLFLLYATNTKQDHKTQQISVKT